MFNWRALAASGALCLSCTLAHAFSPDRYSDHPVAIGQQVASYLAGAFPMPNYTQYHCDDYELDANAATASSAEQTGDPADIPDTLPIVGDDVSGYDVAQPVPASTLDVCDDPTCPCHDLVVPLPQVDFENCARENDPDEPASEYLYYGEQYDRYDPESDDNVNDETNSDETNSDETNSDETNNDETNNDETNNDETNNDETNNDELPASSDQPVDTQPSADNAEQDTTEQPAAVIEEELSAETDEYGYDEYGYDEYGYDEYGYDEYGYDEYGYDEYSEPEGQSEPVQAVEIDNTEPNQQESEQTETYQEEYYDDYRYYDGEYGYDDYYEHESLDSDAAVESDSPNADATLDAVDSRAPYSEEPYYDDRYDYYDASVGGFNGEAVENSSLPVVMEVEDLAQIDAIVAQGNLLAERMNLESEQVRSDLPVDDEADRVDFSQDEQASPIDYESDQVAYDSEFWGCAGCEYHMFYPGRDWSAYEPCPQEAVAYDVEQVEQVEQAEQVEQVDPSSDQNALAENQSEEGLIMLPVHGSVWITQSAYGLVTWTGKLSEQVKNLISQAGIPSWFDTDDSRIPQAASVDTELTEF